MTQCMVRPCVAAFEITDVAIRTGPIEDTSLVARKIAEIGHAYMRPLYLAYRGLPRTPEQLWNHDCIILGHVPSPHRWFFRDNGSVRGIEVTRRIVMGICEKMAKLQLFQC